MSILEDIAAKDGRITDMDRVAAVHEAGHATVAWAYGFQVRAVTIVPFGPDNSRSHGATAIDATHIHTRRDAWACVLLAGYSAELLLAAGLAKRSHSAHDMDEVIKLKLGMRKFFYLLRHTDRLVRFLREYIEALAAQLLRSKIRHMDASQVHAVLAGKLREIERRASEPQLSSGVWVEALATAEH